ncbi:MFS transporter [Paraburkholderia dipogonis]|uniref:MFS transporter n=2 Tax=Paraburkholderia dipogonis TaxID=1211383 RepID=A0A4Y8ML05_9BURK|nr:MFS transporter [Paraburkholderia dipogonis]
MRRLLWPLYFCCFASLASMRVCDSMLPSLEGNLAVDQQHAAYTISVFALAYGVFQLFFGPVGDRFGKVRVIATAAIACALGNLAASACNNIDQLLVARAVSGATAAGIVPLTMAWIGDNVGYERRQEILARFLGATVLGTIFGQLAGGTVPSVTSWRIAFLVVAAVLFTGGILTFREVRRQPAAGDPVQAQVLHNSVSVFRAPWARVVLLTTMVEGGFAYSALAFLPTHFHDAVGLSVSEAGLVVGLYGIGGLVYSRFAKSLLGYLTEAGFATLGGLLLAVSFGALSLCHQLVVSLLSCLGAGFGFYVLHNTLQLNATQMSPACRGTAVSLFSCFLFLGQSIGILSGALLIQRTSTSSLLLPSGIGLLATGGIFSVLLGRRHGPR